MTDLSYSVSQIGEYFKKIFDNEELLQNISIYGEVAGVSISGNNIYFNIKDEKALLPCIMFGLGSLDVIKNGDQVLITGSPRYYVKGGRLSIIVSKVVPYGKGMLYQKFLELKEKLLNEGLFDESRKKPIPKYVKRIGVVSSNTGAVIQDIINVTTRRNNSVDIVLYPVKVQGVGAENQIVSGINYFSNTKNVDVVIVARGGGSFEDLMPFNTEIVARATASCEIPIVSAVGHETDFTIIDFVADLRAPTPSAGAELCVFDKDLEKNKIKTSINSICTRLLIKNENDYALLHKSYKQLITNSTSFVSNIYDGICQNINKMYNAVNLKLVQNEHFITTNYKLLLSYNPINILSRGYAIIKNKDKSITSINEIKKDDTLELILADGKITSVVSGKEKK